MKTFPVGSMKKPVPGNFAVLIRRVNFHDGLGGTLEDLSHLPADRAGRLFLRPGRNDGKKLSASAQAKGVNESRPETKIPAPH